MTDDPASELDDALMDALCDAVLGVSAASAETALAALCAAHPAAASALRRRAASMLAAERALPPQFVPEPDPATIGGSRVVRRLGSGAFGVVYLCEQLAPVRRAVAVKVLRPGAGDRNTLARFASERQALARMNHPAIAQVHDAGALPDGRPYFVMEYVDGVAITQHCERAQADLGTRLDLFLQLCDGVQHAHQRGLIHRDLKPSNVLVATGPAAEGGGRAQPKIIDFGLAKALSVPGEPDAAPGDAMATSLPTESGRVLGTPGYMSPEQASGQVADVDTRSDVFALGVILHELLTGARPWPDGSTIGEPPLASARAKQWAAALRGDLDWILRKALQGEREQRYASVREFADDVRRHRRNEPVAAGPPSSSYRLRKFVRRHRLLVSATALVALSVVLGIAGVLRYAAQAQQSLDRFELLAIQSRLQQARTATATLFPTWPDRLPMFDRWLQEHGEPLQAELPRLERTLAALRVQALPYGAADAEHDRASHPAARELANHHATIAYQDTLLAAPLLQQEAFASMKKRFEDDRTRRRSELPKLEAAVQVRRSWRFADPAQQFLHDTLASVHGELESFVAGDDSMLARARRSAARIRHEAVQDAVALHEPWVRAAAAVAADPRFAGFVLRPQFDLVPLGADPTSGLQEFWHRPSANDETALAVRGSDGELPLGDRFGIIFVLLPPGRTAIGAQKEDPARPAYDPGARIQESPLHEVTLAPFLLAKHELTQAQWLVLTGERTPSALPAGSVRSDGKAVTVRHPVESAAWGDCAAVLEQHGLQLPTEAQWEYGCRAGSTTTWPTGAAPSSLQGYANLADASARAAGIAFEAALDDGHAVHAPVGSLRPNAFGLHDTIGNVAEWCREPFSSLAYLLPAGDGDGLRPVPEVSQRPVRGGSFEDLPAVATAAARAFAPAAARTRSVGVRAARRLQQ
ncbi:MAG: bifunctional serine/threonine-protein kinase/formylglycine-generating enzyme family protein [Planctomycetes bacterium]|jgi:formylglycine-generating enzyme required for sulfatase activity|nr:bifunctional serine/threonine-protein kinase/formylglycine-generating enzyme family protein [Planctomycetota bacterium]